MNKAQKFLLCSFFSCRNIGKVIAAVKMSKGSQRTHRRAVGKVLVCSGENFVQMEERNGLKTSLLFVWLEVRDFYWKKERGKDERMDGKSVRGRREREKDIAIIIMIMRIVGFALWKKRYAFINREVRRGLIAILNFSLSCLCLLSYVLYCESVTCSR